MNITTQLQQASYLIKKHYPVVNNDDFTNKDTEFLDEWFAFKRLNKKLHNQICKITWLDNQSTELWVMCLNKSTAQGRKYSLPHKHADSLTYVTPYNDDWWTFLSGSVENILELQIWECIINGAQPHAFVYNHDAFIAAIAVWATQDMNHTPIANHDGTYNTHILNVQKRQWNRMYIS